MKKGLFILLIFCFCLTLISCSDDEESTTDTTVESCPNTTTGTTTQMGGSHQGVELSLCTVVTTLAGTGYSGSLNSKGTSASFYYPRGITTDGTNLYVPDINNHMIRQIE